MKKILDYFLAIVAIPALLLTVLNGAYPAGSEKPDISAHVADEKIEGYSEPKEMLRRIATKQIDYFVEHNQWAGYPDDGKVFEKIGFKPRGDTQYAYYCGGDRILPTAGEFFFDYPDAAGDWPYGLHPDIDIDDFACMAIGNMDYDRFPDIWIVDKYRKPVHALYDKDNSIPIDIVNAPFDITEFFVSRLDTDWMKDLSRVYVEVNLPAFRTDLFLDGKRLKSYRNAIGMKGFKTPIRTFHIEYFEWNPWWVQPRRPSCEEDGCKPVSPGPWNPLGPVKMMMQSSFMLHGTNQPYKLGSRASHGCIRHHSDDAADLAWKLMVLNGMKGPLEKQDRYRYSGRYSHTMTPVAPIQVSVVYRRMEVIGDKLLLHHDVYGWQPLSKEDILKKLNEFGLSFDDLDEANRDDLFTQPEKTVEVAIKPITPAAPARENNDEN